MRSLLYQFPKQQDLLLLKQQHFSAHSGFFNTEPSPPRAWLIGRACFVCNMQYHPQHFDVCKTIFKKWSLQEYLDSHQSPRLQLVSGSSIQHFVLHTEVHGDSWGPVGEWKVTTMDKTMCGTSHPFLLFLAAIIAWKCCRQLLHCIIYSLNNRELTCTWKWCLQSKRKDPYQQSLGM